VAEAARKQEPDTGAVSVEVQDIAFLPERSAPTDELYSYGYSVVGDNKGTAEVIFDRRYWRGVEWGKDNDSYGVEGRTIAGKRFIRLAAGKKEELYRTIACFRTPSAEMTGWLVGRNGQRAHFGTVKFEVREQQLDACAGNRADKDVFMNRRGARDFIERLREQLSAFQHKCESSDRPFEPFQIEPFGEDGEANRHAFENLLLKKFPETYFNNDGWLTLSTMRPTIELPNLNIWDLFALIDAAAPLGRVHILGKTPKTPKTKGILQGDGGGAIIPDTPQPHTGGLAVGDVSNAKKINPQKELMDRVKDRPDLAIACLKFLESAVTHKQFAGLSAQLTEARIEKTKKQEREKKARYRHKLRQGQTAQP
jgi:uncharacterized protein affecting Mg2+/Co2+ transport